MKLMMKIQHNIYYQENDNDVLHIDVCQDANKL